MYRLLPFLALIPLMGCNDVKSTMRKAEGAAFLAPVQIEKGAGQGQANGLAGRGAQAPAGGADKPVEKEVARKIIYTGFVDVIVTDFDGATQQMLKLVEETGGYVANSKLEAADGNRRKATWTLRVPVAKFRSVIDSAGQLGHVTNTHTDSQDVTDEFFDLEARLKTKHEEEKSLRELLGKTTDKLENLLAIRRELMRVREEIESAQGRLNKLSKLSELTTVTITLQERKDYVPPTAPTFGSRAGNTFSDSADGVWTFLKNVALMAVAAVPWLPFFLVGAAVAFFVLRTLIRWSRRQAAITFAPPDEEPQLAVAADEETPAHR